MSPAPPLNFCHSPASFPPFAACRAWSGPGRAAGRLVWSRRERAVPGMRAVGRRRARFAEWGQNSMNREDGGAACPPPARGGGGHARHWGKTPCTCQPGAARSGRWAENAKIGGEPHVPVSEGGWPGPGPVLTGRLGGAAAGNARGTAGPLLWISRSPWSALRPKPARGEIREIGGRPHVPVSGALGRGKTCMNPMRLSGWGTRVPAARAIGVHRCSSVVPLSWRVRVGKREDPMYLSAAPPVAGKWA